MLRHKDVEVVFCACFGPAFEIIPGVRIDGEASGGRAQKVQLAGLHEWLVVE